MAVGPITWGEINAYDTGTLSMLTAWEKRLIRRLDDASEAVRLGVKPKPTNVSSMKSNLRAARAAWLARREEKS